MHYMEFGVHLPQIDFGDRGFSMERIASMVDTARLGGFRMLAANDHLRFSRPWLDGFTALAALTERSGQMTLATTVGLVTLRGPVAQAKSIAALDLLSGGRVIAGLGPGSSPADYETAGIPFEERWQRLEEAIVMTRELLGGGPSGPGRFYPGSQAALSPLPAQSTVPLWIGSWGSAIGLKRVARLGDGWLASAYNTTPVDFASSREVLCDALAAQGRPYDGFPNALVTMWTYVTEDTEDAERVLSTVLAPMLGRDSEVLRDRLCIGPAARCAELLARYRGAGCQQVVFWPLGDEVRQLELLINEVIPQAGG